MPKDYPRSHRVADQIQQELSVLIRDQLKDPRLPSMLTITSVDVTRDLSLARIYYTIIGDSDRAEAQTALESGGGFLRRQLGARLSVRAVPQLQFRYDQSIEEGARMSALISDAVKTNTTDADAQESGSILDTVVTPTQDSGKS